MTNEDKLFTNKEKLALIAIITNTSVLVNMVAIDFYKRTHYKINIDKLAEEYYYDKKEENVYDLDSINYETALEIIRNNELLSDDIKEILLNEDLLQDVFKYYKGTLMEYLVNYKLNGLNVEYYSENEKNLAGYVYHDNPNTIYLLDSLENENKIRTVAHEWIHILQLNQINYHYLIEATAELMASEYYDFVALTYREAVDNLRLLIDIIGPLPILKIIFSGDTTDFNEVLRDNLSANDCNSLIIALQSRPEKADHKLIRDILFTLYKNMYGKDITEDENIGIFYREELIYPDGDPVFHGIARYFLNPRKMCENEIAYSNAIIACSDRLEKSGLIKKEYTAYYTKEITYEELINNYLEETLVYEDDYSEKINGVIAGMFYYKVLMPIRNEDKDYYLNPAHLGELYELPGVKLHLQEAFEKGYIKGYLKKAENEIEDFTNWKFYSIENTAIPLKDNIIVLGSHLQVVLDSIRTRFPDQYEQMINDDEIKLKLS